MNTNDFQQIIDEQIARSTATLYNKSDEYAFVDDRLHNFRIAASLNDCSMKQALGGMMLKHTISIYDMINSDEDFPLVVWDEKIGDHINYLLILSTIVRDQTEKMKN